MRLKFLSAEEIFSGMQVDERFCFASSVLFPFLIRLRLYTRAFNIMYDTYQDTDMMINVCNDKECNPIKEKHEI